jgi:uncharacterized protein (DUF1778 family)
MKRQFTDEERIKARDALDDETRRKLSEESRKRFMARLMSGETDNQYIRRAEWEAEIKN